MREKVREGLPRRGYTFDRAGLMSAAKSTLPDNVHHRTLPPWGLYFLKFPRHFPIIPIFVNAQIMMMRCHGWLHVAHSIAHKKKYNPQGGSIPPSSLPGVASYRRQPWAIKSITPMGLHRHQPFITTHDIDVSRNMGIYHHTTTRGTTMPQRGITCRMAIHRQTTP